MKDKTLERAQLVIDNALESTGQSTKIKLQLPFLGGANIFAARGLDAATGQAYFVKATKLREDLESRFYRALLNRELECRGEGFSFSPIEEIIEYENFRIYIFRNVAFTKLRSDAFVTSAVGPIARMNASAKIDRLIRLGIRKAKYRTTFPYQNFAVAFEGVFGRDCPKIYEDVISCLCELKGRYQALVECQPFLMSCGDANIYNVGFADGLAYFLDMGRIGLNAPGSDLYWIFYYLTTRGRASKESLMKISFLYAQQMKKSGIDVSPNDIYQAAMLAYFQKWLRIDAVKSSTHNPEHFRFCLDTAGTFLSESRSLA